MYSRLINTRGIGSIAHQLMVYRPILSTSHRIETLVLHGIETMNNIMNRVMNTHIDMNNRNEL